MKKTFSVLLLIALLIPLTCQTVSAAVIQPYPYKQFTTGDAYTKTYTSNEIDTVKLIQSGLYFDATLTFNGYVKGEGKVIEQKAHVTLPEKPGFFNNYHYYDKFYYIGSESEEGHCRIYIHAIEDSVESFSSTVEDCKQAMELEQTGRSMGSFSWRTSDENIIEDPYVVREDPDGSVLLSLHLKDEWNEEEYGYYEVVWLERVFRIEGLPNMHFVAYCKMQFSIGTGRFLGAYDPEKHSARYKEMLNRHEKEKAEFLSYHIDEYVTDPSNYEIEWLEPDIIQNFDYADVVQNAWANPGEDSGVTVPAAIVIGVLSGGAALAAAAAVSANGQDGSEKNKSYRMYVQKDFGDTIRRGLDTPVKIRARMAEIDPSGAVRDRDDLTAMITASGDGMTVHSCAVYGRYCEASVTVPETNSNDTASITFSFAGEGGSFTNTVIFRLVDGPMLKFIDDEGYAATCNCGIDAIPGDGFTYSALFTVVDAPVPPELKDISAVNTGSFDVGFEQTQNPSVFRMKVVNNTDPDPDHDIFAKVRSEHFEIHVMVEGEKEPLKGYVTMYMYPEGLTVQSKEEGRKNDVKYIRIQAYEKEYAGDFDKKWQVSEMQFTLAVRGDDKALIDPKGMEFTFDGIRGAGGKGTTAYIEKSLAEKYEYQESHGMHNEKYTCVIEPKKELWEPDNGTFFIVALPVECAYGSDVYKIEVPLRLRGRDPDPMEDWNKEYEKTRERIEKFSLPGTKAGWLKKLESCALEPKVSVEELRLVSKWILREYMDYWTDQNKKDLAEASMYNVIVNVLEWTKFAGDCAFSFLVNAYAGPVADAILSPAKDFITGAIGEVIAARNYGEEIDVDKFEFSKNLAAAGDNLVSNSIDLKDWRKAAQTLGWYFCYSAIKNYLLKLNEKGESDIFGALCEGFKDMTAAALKSKAGELIGKWIKDSKRFQEKIGPKIASYFKETNFDTLQKKLNDSLGLDGELRKLAGYANDKVFEAKVADVVEKYISGLAGAGFDKIREVYDSSKFGIEGTHVTYCFNIDLFDAYHFGIKLDLTVILMTMSGDLSGWFYDYFFKGTPSAGDVVALPKDPPLPPRYN